MVTGAEAVERWRAGVARADTSGIAKAVDAAVSCGAKARAAGSSLQRVATQVNCVRSAFGLPPVS